jgi:predicted nuclease of predicted toxin-antitoxin system
MRLLLDEHVSPDVASGFRARGHDVVSVIDVGLRTADDPIVWQHAIRENRAVVTYNRDDFLALASQSFEEEVSHPGLVMISAKTILQSDIGGLVRALDQLLMRLPEGSNGIAGQVLFLTRATEPHLG